MEVGGETVKPLQPSWLPNARLLMASSPFLCTDSHPQGTPGGPLGSSVAHGCQGALLTPCSHSHLQSPSCAFLCRSPYLITLFFPHHLRLPCPQLMSLTIWALISTILSTTFTPRAPSSLLLGLPAALPRRGWRRHRTCSSSTAGSLRWKARQRQLGQTGALQGMSAATPE